MDERKLMNKKAFKDYKYNQETASNPLTLAFGDVVKFVEAVDYGEEVHIGEIHIISHTHDGYNYATSRGAWWNRDCFKLIRRADKKSIAKMRKILEEEGM